jgi:hypothetical protein
MDVCIAETPLCERAWCLCRRGEETPRLQAQQANTRAETRCGPCKCVKCQCGESGVLGVPRQSEGDLWRVKCHRGKPLLCPWVRGPVLEPGAAFAQCVKYHSEETFWWEVPRQSEGDLLCVKCHRGKPLLCLWVSGPVLGPGAVLAQCVKCHCGETFWWGVPRQSEGDSRCVKCHRGKSVLCPWTTGPVLGPGAVLAQCVKYHCGETFWWGVPRQSEGDSRRVLCHRENQLAATDCTY